MSYIRKLITVLSFHLFRVFPLSLECLESDETQEVLSLEEERHHICFNHIVDLWIWSLPLQYKDTHSEFDLTKWCCTCLIVYCSFMMYFVLMRAIERLYRNILVIPPNFRNEVVDKVWSMMTSFHLIESIVFDKTKESYLWFCFGWTMHIDARIGDLAITYFWYSM